MVATRRHVVRVGGDTLREDEMGVDTALAAKVDVASIAVLRANNRTGRWPADAAVPRDDVATGRGPLYTEPVLRCASTRPWCLSRCGSERPW